jgi:hypothetical protein
MCGWVDGCVGVRVCVGGWIDGWMEEGRMDGWMDGWKSR